MERRIVAADWKHFRQVLPLALDRFCQRVLAEICEVATDNRRSAPERYTAMYELLQRRDGERAAAFDNPRRSTALIQLARIQAAGLLSQEELAGFGPQTQASVGVFLELWQA